MQNGSTQTPKSSAAIRCPYCDNRGEPDGGWQIHSPTPFKLVENVPRLWIFTSELDAKGMWRIVADASRDQVIWEGGTNLRLVCMTCFGEFPLANHASVEFV